MYKAKSRKVFMHSDALDIYHLKLPLVVRTIPEGCHQFLTISFRIPANLLATESGNVPNCSLGQKVRQDFYY